MSMPFYTDHQVQRAIVEGLRSRSVDVLTAFDDGTATWDDEALLARATQLGRILFTRDDVFLRIAAEWTSQGRHFSGVVYCHPRKIDIGGAVRDLEAIAKVLSSDEIRDQVVFLPL